LASLKRTDLNLNLPHTIAALIDHTLLKPESTRAEVTRVCAEAKQASFASVCVNPFWVRLAKEALEGSSIRVCSVIGFPLGANETEVKVTEAERALFAGAKELDVVQNIGALRSGDTGLVQAELKRLANLVHDKGAILKVILETSLLTEGEKSTACELAVESGVDFVKTSTGFAGGGATTDDVRLMRSIVGHNIGVKASGGIRTLSALRDMVNAGANRIGTSSGVSILRELQSDADRTSGSADPGTY
jgi:deoxyribose-phosphate aldolase